MKPSEKKQKLVARLVMLFEKLDIRRLYGFPNQKDTQEWLADVAAVLKNLDEGDYQEMIRLSKTVGLSDIREERKKAALEINQFLGRKVAEYKIYDFDAEQEETVKNDTVQKIKRRLEKEGLFVQSNIDGEDEHLMIGARDGTGEKAHLIVDGATGEVRVEPNRKAPHDVLQKIETMLTIKDGDKIRTTRTSMAFVEGEIAGDDIPVLDIAKELEPSGGSQGHYVYFTVSNIGSKPAIDCSIEVRGFGYKWKSPTTFMQPPLPAIPKRIEYKISDEQPFSKEIPELRVILKYQDSKGNKYKTYRDLTQRLVPSGSWYEFVVGDFHPAVLIRENPIISVSPIRRLDRTLLYYSDFEVKHAGGTKTVRIAVPNIMFLGWGFSELGSMQTAIEEIGLRKIKKMIEANNFIDYTFSQADFTPTNSQGYESYRLSKEQL